MKEVKEEFIKGYLVNHYRLKECDVMIDGYNYNVRIVTELGSKEYCTRYYYDLTYIELICKDLIERINVMILNEYRNKGGE